jgi:hypothetical protein
MRRSRKKKKKKHQTKPGMNEKVNFSTFFLPFWIFFLLGYRFEDPGFFSLYFFSLLRNHQKWGGERTTERK